MTRVQYGFVTLPGTLCLAELGARNNDEDVRAMLQRHGISYSVNTPAPTAAPTPANAVRK